MREGTGLRRGGSFPLSRVWWRDREQGGPTRTDGLGGQTPIIDHFICPLTTGAGGIVQVDEDGLSRNPIFNNDVTEGGSDLFQGD